MYIYTYNVYTHTHTHTHTHIYIYISISIYTYRKTSSRVRAASHGAKRQCLSARHLSHKHPSPLLSPVRAHGVLGRSHIVLDPMVMWHIHVMMWHRPFVWWRDILIIQSCDIIIIQSCDLLVAHGVDNAHRRQDLEHDYHPVAGTVLSHHHVNMSHHQVSLGSEL